MTKSKLSTIPAAYLALRVDLPEALARRQAMMDAFRPALDAAFSAVNGKASSHTLTALDAIRAAREAENTLADMGVSKALRGGTEVWHRGAGPSANAYRYRVATTDFTLRRDSKGNWAMVSVARVEVRPKEAAGYRMTVSEAARDAMIKHALRSIFVHAT